jgi:hypothetical protein
VRCRSKLEHPAQEIGRALAFARIFDLPDEVPLLGGVAAAEKEDAIAGKAVPAGSTGFLIVAFHVLGDVVVHDVAHVRLVDPHPEGDRRADHLDLVANEQVLIPGPSGRQQAGVIRPGRDPRRRQPFCQIFRRLTARDVDDAAFPRALERKGQELLERVALFEHAVP